MATRTRWAVLWFLVLISVVRSMDAVNFSVAAKQIIPEYGFTNVQMGILYTVFTAGYALFHLPGGWLGDTVGPRRMLTIAILWWSVFTGLTAVAGSWWLAGLVLAGFWYHFVTDNPEEHPRVSAQELQHIRGGEQLEKRPTPWRAILTHPNVWLLMLANFGFGYGIYIFQSWFYLYLVNVRGFSIMQGGVLTTGPFIASAILGPVGGWCSDVLVRRYDRTLGRRIVAVSGFLLAAFCLYLGAKAANPYTAVVMLSFGDGFLYFAGAAAVGTTIDIAGPHSGTVYGVVATVLQIGGAVAPTLTPMIAERFGWEAALHVAGFFAVVAACVWLFIDAQHRIGTTGTEQIEERQLAAAR